MLKLEKVDVSYGSIKALHGISVEVKNSEIVALIGANGAGKSTTLRTISGLLKPSSKESIITFKDVQIQGMPPHKIVEMGLSHVPEGRRVFPEMSVYENLLMGAHSRKGKPGQEDFDRVYHHFPRLKERIKQVAGTLSGGEQQMLAMGRALMTRPDLLILDEPSMGLAPMLVEEIFHIIEDINAAGTTILLVEQNAHLALEISHRAYVLETGEIVLEGPARELAQNEDIRKAYLGE
ncbi:ABC-type branched-chain amino acid transport systems, ATPase component [Desulfosporosinus orientis DSM 765]|uniref:ABC-type branched-chain amino acid transport systems, ATPase component n=1 Tax=Desulfosporosinus orientis (strain ATCC 19365 / DSM 765 / NCIMB 8382 / VKM B-1628 / Singapore I) TaxID=768706 RepID=G7WE34_DESOD|nr:ABC transporter ATP-binding protein [Desulfosporosinus orientis]AET69432.1 ABC-type branched-chain amino acid transport systems, ATPase component [Desulfosporosinus orientis DSM 765]